MLVAEHSGLRVSMLIKMCFLQRAKTTIIEVIRTAINAITAVSAMAARLKNFSRPVVVTKTFDDVGACACGVGVSDGRILHTNNCTAHT